MKTFRRWAWQIPQPDQPLDPYKPPRQLTCPHGRFWKSCPRCRLPPDATYGIVGIRGDSRLQASREATP